MEKNQKITIDKSKIKMAIQAGIPLSIVTYTLPHDMEMYMKDVLTVFLTELNQEHMVEYLTYCLQELIGNAKKANTKRVFFEDRKLNINDKNDYEKGMVDFKECTLNNIKYYLSQQKKEGLYIKLILQARNNKIKIEVRNNVALTIFEYKRIHDKLSRAQQYTSIQEVLDQILDETEGAGLGLIIMILMLRKIGLTEENYQVLSDNKETITRLILPFNAETTNAISLISKEFVNMIDELPQFPENITVINRLLNDPDSKMADIAMHISNDVALTGELLKLVNSAAFALASPCRSISDAVKMVGIRGIRNLLYSIGSMENLTNYGDSDEKKKILWTHSYRVAFYSYNLAKNFCTSPAEKTVVEDSYVCGLLHDMGKLIFETAHPDLIKKVDELCVKKGIKVDLIERLVAGSNHGEIGSLIAEKWNFPDVIVNVIRYHHQPENAPQSAAKITKLVYLADLMTHYVDGDIEFYQIDLNILSEFKITSEEQMQLFSNRLEEAFKRQQN